MSKIGRKIKSGFRSSNFRFILTMILIGILSVGLIAVGVKLNKMNSTKTISSTSFVRGGLDNTGTYVETTASIYTQDYITSDGLKVDIKDDADVSYKLFFYGEDKTFIESSNALTTDYNSANPEGAMYVRIVITPNVDANISLAEIYTYAHQLTITVNK